MTSARNYNNQIGGVIINPTDGDNAYDYIIECEIDHAAGTATYIASDDTTELYRRNVPNTARWHAQVFVDIEEAAQASHPGQTVYIHKDDQD